MLTPFVRAVQSPRVGAAFLAVVTLLALAGVAQLDFDDDYRSIFRSGSEEFRLLEQMTTEFGREENVVVLVVGREDVLEPRVLRELWRLQQALLRVDGVELAYSVSTLPELSLLLRVGLDDARIARAVEGLEGHPMVLGRLVSPNRDVALVIADLGDEELALDEVEGILADIEPLAADHGARVTGIPPIRVEVIRSVQREQLLFNVIAVCLAGLLALAVFGRVASVALVAAGPILGVVWTLGAMGWAGESVNVLNNVVPQLVLAVGFTDAVHLLYHIRRARVEGSDRVGAAIDAIREVGMACAVTSLTTAVGFASLVFAGAEIVQRFGVACAVGALLSFVAVTTTVPLLASTRLGEGLLRRNDGRALERSGDRLARVLQPILRKPGWLAAGAVALLVIGVTQALDLEPDFRYTENLPRRSPALESVAIRDAAFGGSLPVFARVEWPTPGAAETAEGFELLGAVEEVFARHPVVSAVTSPRHLAAAVGRGSSDAVPSPEALRRVPSALRGRWLGPEGRVARVAGVVPDRGSAELQPAFGELDGRLEALAAQHPGVEIRLAGLTPVAVSASRGMIADLGRSLGFAAVVIFGCIALAYRSVTLGLASVVPNVVPLLAVTTVLAATVGTLQYASVAVLSVGLGLAVDDTIHLLTAFRRHGGRAAGSHAVEAALRTVGVALCSTTLLLLAGLGPLVLSALPTIQLFGALMCVLLGAALVADLVFLPALLLLASERTREDQPEVAVGDGLLVEGVR